MTHTPDAALEEMTIAEMQQRMAAGDLSAVALTEAYLARIHAIDKHTINSVIETNPDAADIAKALDAERAAGTVRGPLHGIPILLKDNIDTGDRMQTSAGSLALVGQPALQDAVIAAKLRAAGAVILGKTNLSEWANFRSTGSSSGWSGRGGQTRNPYALDRNPSGSSSGSAAAVSANLCAVAIGTETDGSIISPSSHCGVVGIKPTVGLTSRAGVVPISHSQDTVGPHARCVADAAAVLSAIADVDLQWGNLGEIAQRRGTSAPRLSTADLLSAGNLGEIALQGARIGVLRGGSFSGYSAGTDAIYENALRALRDAGAVLIDPVEIPTAGGFGNDPAELVVLVHEFKRDLNAYLATRSGVPVRTMADVIAFNKAHANAEMPFFDQEWMILADSDPFPKDVYEKALARGRSMAGTQGIDAALAAHQLDALVAPSDMPAGLIDLVNGGFHPGDSTSLAAKAGYPIVTVPAGMWQGLPVGLSFIGTAWSEPALIQFAYAFEQATHARVTPQLLPTLPLNESMAGRRLEKTAWTILNEVMKGKDEQQTP
jgi:amidase